MSEDGKEILLGFRGSGDLVGEIAVLSGSTRSATVTAATERQGTVIRAASCRRRTRCQFSPVVDRIFPKQGGWGAPGNLSWHHSPAGRGWSRPAKLLYSE